MKKQKKKKKKKEERDKRVAAAPEKRWDIEKFLFSLFFCLVFCLVGLTAILRVSFRSSSSHTAL
jgi:hypothetical protein